MDQQRLPHPPSGRRFGRLLERDAELAAVEGLVAEAAEGDGRLLVVEGPAGIGKTRLVVEARRRADAAGFEVRTARGAELERDFPFGVVRQLFEPVLADPAAAARLLQGSAAAARPVLAPLESGGEVPADASFAALHGLYWLCVNLSGDRPLMLAVDDLHWCDRPSLRFLAYLVRRLEGLPLLVAGSLRPAEPGADAALLAELAGDPMAVRLQPAPLSPGATGELIGARLGAEPEGDFAAVCHRATGGNPLLLNELLAAMASQDVLPDAAHAGAVVREVGPRAVSRAVLARLSRLPPGAVAVARAAAVLGEGADVRRVAELAGLPPAAVAEATGELTRAEILRPEVPIGFVHPLVRAAVYHELPPGERQHQHARAARLLDAAGAPLDVVAAHLLACPGAGEAWVVGVLERAARDALARGAAESAVAYLTRAIDEPPEQDRRPGVLLELGVAQSHLSGRAAADPLRAAYALTADPLQRAGIALRLVEVLYFTNAADEVVGITQEAIAGLGPSHEHRDLADRLLAWRLAVASLDPVRQPVWDHDVIRARVAGLGDSQGARMVAGMLAYHWALSGGRGEEVVPAAVHAVGGGVFSRADAAGAPQIGGLIALIMADRQEAVAGTQELMDAAHRHGSLLIATGAQTFRGLLLILRGELQEAEELLSSAVEDHKAWGFESVKVFYSSYLAQALIELGEVDRARRVLADVGMPPDRELPHNSTMAWWLHARLRLLAAAGELHEALDLSHECERRFAQAVPNPAWIPWRSLRAEVLLRLGRREEAAAIAASELGPARTWGAPHALGRALRVLGTVGGDLDVLRDAVGVLEGSPARLEHARALAALGTALRLDRRPSEARAPLRQALEIAGVCGAAPLAEHARAELLATGARPRSDALSGVGALTASERRVADMAVEGVTNKDIAQALYVTPKTVEVHLSNAYRKLGIRSRRELPGVLAGAAAGRG